MTHPDEGGKTPFGGVRQDMWCIKKAANGELGAEASHKSELGHSPQAGLMLLCAADLPFSLIGDLVTWPYTWSYSWINQPIPVPPVAADNPPATQAMPPAPVTPQPAPLPIPPVTQVRAESRHQGAP